MSFPVKHHRVLVLGDSGKTSLIRRFVNAGGGDDTANNSNSPTRALEKCVKFVVSSSSVPATEEQIEIFDVPNSITSNLSAMAPICKEVTSTSDGSGVIVVVDASFSSASSSSLSTARSELFTRAQFWMRQLHKIVIFAPGSGLMQRVVLVLTKCDDDDGGGEDAGGAKTESSLLFDVERNPDDKMLLEGFARENGFLGVVCTSARNNKNVAAPFQVLLRKFSDQQQQSNSKPPSVVAAAYGSTAETSTATNACSSSSSSSSSAIPPPPPLPTSAAGGGRGDGTSSSSLAQQSGWFEIHQQSLPSVRRFLVDGVPHVEFIVPPREVLLSRPGTTHISIMFEAVSLIFFVILVLTLFGVLVASAHTSTTGDRLACLHCFEQQASGTVMFNESNGVCFTAIIGKNQTTGASSSSLSSIVTHSSCCGAARCCSSEVLPQVRLVPVWVICVSSIIGVGLSIIAQLVQRYVLRPLQKKCCGVAGDHYGLFQHASDDADGKGPLCAGAASCCCCCCCQYKPREDENFIGAQARSTAFVLSICGSANKYVYALFYFVAVVYFFYTVGVVAAGGTSHHHDDYSTSSSFQRYSSAYLRFLNGGGASVLCVAWSQRSAAFFCRLLQMFTDIFSKEDSKKLDLLAVRVFLPFADQVGDGHENTTTNSHGSSSSSSSSNVNSSQQQGPVGTSSHHFIKAETEATTLLEATSGGTVREARIATGSRVVRIFHNFFAPILIAPILITHVIPAAVVWLPIAALFAGAAVAVTYAIPINFLPWVRNAYTLGLFRGRVVEENSMAHRIYERLIEQSAVYRHSQIITILLVRIFAQVVLLWFLQTMTTYAALFYEGHSWSEAVRREWQGRTTACYANAFTNELDGYELGLATLVMSL